ncbi:MAG: peptidoglycan DD-metalloendopeptidase family protein, partial [Notoacmeibacter sp.]
GIDIAMPAGTSVKAAEGGTVIYAGNGLAEFGNTVLIRHDNGLVTVYGHADKLNVQRNQKVNKGDVIALSGASGKADAPKLHFEVRKNSVPVDPQKYLQ